MAINDRPARSGMCVIYVFKCTALLRVNRTDHTSFCRPSGSMCPWNTEMKHVRSSNLGMSNEFPRLKWRAHVFSRRNLSAWNAQTKELSDKQYDLFANLRRDEFRFETKLHEQSSRGTLWQQEKGASASARLLPLSLTVRTLKPPTGISTLGDWYAFYCRKDRKMSRTWLSVLYICVFRPIDGFAPKKPRTVLKSLN